MLEIKRKEISCFSCFVGIIILLTIATIWCLDRIPLGDFRGVILAGAAAFGWFGHAIVVHRLFLRARPMPTGLIRPGSDAAFTVNVSFLFRMLFFRPLMNNAVFPLPLYRVLYRMLGARIGRNSHCAGYIMDACLTEMGDHSIIGGDAQIMAHVIQRDELILERVRIGNHVTVGLGAVILPGVTIEDHAVVAVGAVAPRRTHIGSGEVWGGVPATCLKTAKTLDAGSRRMDE